jgi:hypothetical protein
MTDRTQEPKPGKKPKVKKPKVEKVKLEKQTIQDLTDEDAQAVRGGFMIAGGVRRTEYLSCRAEYDCKKG